MSVKKKNFIKKYFTITELVVAMGVFGLLSMFLLRTFSGVQNVWKNSSNQSGTFESADLVMNMLSDEVKAIVNINAYDSTLSSSASPLFHEFYYKADSGKIYIGYLTKASGKSTLSGFYYDNTNYVLYHSDSFLTPATDTPFISSSTTVSPVSSGDIVAENVIGFSVKRFNASYSEITANPGTDLPDYIIVTLEMVDSDKMEQYKKLKTANNSDYKALVRTFKRLIQINKVNFNP